MRPQSPRESALRSEGEEVPGDHTRSHRDRLKRRTDKVRRQADRAEALRQIKDTEMASITT